MTTTTTSYLLVERFADAERAYACAVLHLGSAEIIEALPAGHFADPVARGIVELAGYLHRCGDTVDLVTVSLVRTQSPPNWSRDCVDVYTIPGAIPANWRAYREIVAEGHIRREAVKLAERILRAAQESELTTLVELVNNHE